MLETTNISALTTAELYIFIYHIYIRDGAHTSNQNADFYICGT